MKKRQFKVEDFMKFKFAYDPQLSPDGSKILYVLSTTEDEKYLPNVWIYDIANKSNRQFTFSNVDERPKWSPCGSQIAFISKRNGKKQLFVMPAFGGEARPLVELRYGVNDPVWSPCGKKIAFTANMFEGQTLTELKNLAEDDRDKNEKKQHKVVRQIDKLKFKLNGLPGVGLLGTKVKHIFVADVATGEIEQVTSGQYSENTPVWAPNSKSLVFQSHRCEDADYTIRVQDLWQICLQDKKITKLTNTDGQYRLPVFNADGRYLAFYGHKLEFESATNSRLFVRDNNNGEIRELTANFDNNLGINHGSDMKLGAPFTGAVWSKCGQFLYVTSSIHGSTHIHKVDFASGDVTQLTSGSMQITGYSFNLKTNKSAVVYSNALQPGDIALVDLTTGELERLTKVNDEILNECYIAEPEEFWYRGVDNWEIQGWILKPYGFKEGVKYPFVLEVHGGPHSLYAPSFFYEFQLLAAAGYVVMFTNPRGSQGYGQKFADAVRGDYGGNDYGDLMKAVDYAETLPYVDKDRMGVTGGSYGGFMTNWIVGHTNRFKAAVTQRSISNWLSFFGVSDIGYFFGESEIGCTPWGNVTKMWDSSPLKYVEKVNTPLLMIHGEEDIRCPIEQADQFYVYLKALKRKVSFLRFPQENHELSRSGQPNRRIARLKAIVDWFNDHIERNKSEYNNF